MAEGDPKGPGAALVELRVLDGANLYFPRPAIKLTLELPGLLSLPEERAAALAVRSRPGPEPTQLVAAYPWRRQHAAKALGRAVAELAASMGTPGLAERVEAAGAAVAAVEPGPGPSLPVPQV